MLFLALVENYVRAEEPALVVDKQEYLSMPSIVVIGSAVQYEIVPSFGIKIHESGPKFDFESDDSLQKFLHDDHPFNDSAYIPTDLLPITSNFTANASKAFKLREEAGVQFADMAWHFWNAFSGDRLYIVSAYRGSSFQAFLIRQWCSLLKCAKVGTSEHQAGLAVDLKVISKWGKAYWLDVAYPNTYYDRLKNNAHRFWFHNTYQKWVEIDGKIAEWRHWRYLWTELATILYDNDQTFAEYYFTTVNSE